jgi:hypothetical protein
MNLFLSTLRKGWNLIKPYEKFTIQTSLHPDEVTQLLSDLTEIEPPESFSPFSRPSGMYKAFSGTIYEDSFHISPRYRGRSDHGANGVVIRGKICPNIWGALINITIMINPVFGLFFLLPWLIVNFSFGGFEISKFTTITLLIGFVYIGYIAVFKSMIAQPKSEIEALLKR